jgi:hypothetical protein
LILRDLLEVFAFMFLTGLGAFRLIVPAFLRTRALYVILVTGIGFAQFSIVVAYVIYAEKPVATALSLAALVGAVTLLLSLIGATRGVTQGWLQIPANWLAREVIFTSLSGVAALGVLAIVLWPVLKTGLATTPFRIGIDQVGYGESAQFLREGGTTGSIRTRLLKELGTTSPEIANQQNLKDLRFESYVDSEFLLKAKRWGYPGTLAAMTAFTGSPHVFSLAFLILIFDFALTLGIVYYLVRVHHGLPRAFGMCAMLAIAMNCNLLNVYYEGQYAQVFATPFVLIYLTIYLRARGIRDYRRARRSLLMFSATSALMVAALFSAFNESLVLLVAIVAVTTALDLVFYRKTSLAALEVAIIGFLGGAAILWPLSRNWIAYTFANLSGLARAGFWQPHWASLAEMIGLCNMYVTPGYTLMARSPLDAAANAILSVIAAVMIGRFFLRSGSLDRTFWIAPFVLILVEYVKSRYVDDILNYPFMKLYTAFLPLVCVVAFVAIYRFGNQFGRKGRWLGYTATLVAIITGGTYIMQYVRESGVVTPEMFALYNGGNERRFDDYALITRDSSIHENMFVPILSMHWLDQSDTQKLLARDLDKKIVLVLSDRGMTCRLCLTTYFAGDVIYEDSSSVFINTQLPVRLFCDKHAFNRNVDSLGMDGQKQWVEDKRAIDGSYVTSYRQCDFNYLQKLIVRASRSEESHD